MRNGNAPAPLCAILSARRITIARVAAAPPNAYACTVDHAALVKTAKAQEAFFS
jgi:hypothetical protein